MDNIGQTYYITGKNIDNMISQKNECGEMWRTVGFLYIVPV